MKLKFSIVICMLSFFSASNAFANLSGNNVHFRGLVLVDSLNYQYKTGIASSKTFMLDFDKTIDNKMVLTKEDLKKLALNYALLKKADRASYFADRYIKQVHNTTILHNEMFKEIRASKEFSTLVKKYKTTLNGWILFFFSSGLVGIFIAVVLNLRKKGDIIANVLISLFVLIHSLFLIHLSLYLSKFNLNFPHILYSTTIFSFLYGPLLYFYYKRITQKYIFKWVDLLHLLPTVFLIIYLLPIYLLSADEKLEILYNRFENTYFLIITVVFMKSILLVIYGYLTYKVYKASIKERPKQQPEIKRWQRNIIILNITYILSYLVYGVVIANEISIPFLIYPQVFLLSIIVLYVGYVAYVQPKVFSKKYLFDENLLLKYQKSGLTSTLSLELKEQLLELFQEEKIFKDNSISLAKLSEILATTRHNTSQVINEHFDMNFFKFINKFRIYEAIDIFEHDYCGNMSIIDVAYEVGFNNKVTFNKAFKEETKRTPSQYLKELNAN